MSERERKRERIDKEREREGREERREREERVRDKLQANYGWIGSK